MINTQDELDKIADLHRRKEELEKELVNFEIDPDDFEEQYREMLEEISGPVKIGSYEYSAAHVLEEVDPTAYRCGLNDYVDSIDKEESDEYQAVKQELEEVESEIELCSK